MATVNLTLTGLDGSNPLGFLCALGALRTLSNAWPDSGVKMKWTKNGAAWRPVLRASHADLDGKDQTKQKEVIVEALFNELKNMCSHPAKRWKDIHNIPAGEYRKYALEAVECFFSQSAPNQRPAEWAAALACDGVINDKYVKDTAFRTMSGQGHQHFLERVRLLREKLQQEQVAEALFDWKYKDEGLNLRFDPSEDRRHALRWKSPDKDTIKTVWGANRLAAEGLPLYPVFPLGNRLRTTGFRGSNKDDTFWTWPIWGEFLGVLVVRSILALPALQAERPPRSELSPLGIVDVYRTQRINVGMYRAFTAAQAV